MCGIAGLWSVDGGEHAIDVACRAMTDAMVHRGPDDDGLWSDRRRGIALGHRRLSIVDLSPEGHQPMVSSSGRYVIAFNGEVFNFEALRASLVASGDAPIFRGHSDTEVMLAAIDRWGLPAAVERFVGMFAFALWDRRDGSLHLVRDRLGIKPLYYGFTRNSLVFGSELKSLVAAPSFDRTIDRASVVEFLRYGYVPGPRSIYEAARKLEPGTIATFTTPGRGTPAVVRYWSAAEAARKGLAEPFRGNAEEATDELERLLREFVGLRMVADVPLGAFLSGGIDSSTVVAMMQAQSARPVRTFSIGNQLEAYDEGHAAAAVAAHLGTDHTAIVVTPEEARAVIPRLPFMYDEPFADSSQIPTLLVSQLARRHVTVALSGDGGDELFGGYNRHVWAARMWGLARHVPTMGRRAAADLLRAVPPAAWARLLQSPGGLLPAVRLPSQKVDKVARVLGAKSFEEGYRRLCSQWMEPERVARGASPRALDDALPLPDPIHSMMLQDLTAYLPDDILVKVDRASMAVSLEARVPLLDHRLVEFAWTLPTSMKIRGTTGKWILRRVLERYVPRHLFERPKMGFGVPIGEWLRGPLREWAEGLLEPRRIDGEGYLDSRPIATRWREHLAGRGGGEHALWAVLMFEAWLDATT